MANVELNVRTQLKRVVDELNLIADAAGKVGEGLGDASKQVGDDINKQTKKTEGYLAGLQSLGGRVANQLKNDFKSLASINALAGSLKFSEMFRGSIKETVTLNDAIRKLGSTLGIAGGEAQKFQDKMTKALSVKGLSSVAGANALGGLAETAVRGEGALMNYATQAGMLASVSRQQGSEGQISKGMAGVITARGGNVNDATQLQGVAQDVLRIRMATGKSATEILDAMNQLFSGANKAFQKRLQGGGAVTLASAALFGGKDATSFLEKYLKSNRFQRFGPEAQGLGSIIGADGSLNLANMQATLAEARGRGLGDEQAGLTTFGMSDEEAKGFIRLTQALEENAKSVEAARKKQVDLNSEYRKSLGLGESFNRILNKTKGVFSTGLTAVTGGATDFLASAGDTRAGALATTAGAGVLAALLAGGGLRGLGRGSGLVAAAGIEGATGREVVPVYVTNMGAGGLLGGAGLGGGAGKGAGASGLLSGAGLVGAGIAVGTAVVAAGLANEQDLEDRAMEPLQRAKAYDDEQKAIISDLNKTLKKITVVNTTGRDQRVKVELNERQLKASRQPSRGASYGP